MIKAEWAKILTTRKMLISVIAVLFIPVMYAGMFLWAFWDPYKGLEDLPVAVVNEDKGAEMDGKKLKIGEELIDKLVDSKEFDFIEVSKKDAEKGLHGRTYYMMIEIPENFSEHATTLLDDHPSKLTINYVPNEGLNFLGGQIGETAMELIRAEVNTKVASTYAETLFDSISEAGEGLAKAADGSTELDEGAKKLADGTGDLKGYLEQLASGTVQLSDGTNQLAQGVQKAQTGANELAGGMGKLQDGAAQLQQGAQSASEGAGNLHQGVSDYTAGVGQVAAGLATINEKSGALVSGADQLASSAGQLSGAAEQLSGGASQVTNGIGALSQQLEAVMGALPEEQAGALRQSLAQLQQGSAQVSGGLGELAGGAAQLQQGAQQLNGGVQQLSQGNAQALGGAQQLAEKSGALVAGAAQLQQGNATLASKLGEFNAGVQSAAAGTQQLASGLNQLAGGTSTLQSGTSELASKSGELANGSDALVDGSKKLSDGTGELSNKLGEASEKANDVKSTDETYDMMANPVTVEKESLNPVKNYGTGFSPYFISLGLFVGALLISIVFPFVEPAVRPTSATAWYTSKVFVLIVVGFIQSIITVLVVKYALGLEVVSMPYFILTALITSYTYLFMIQMLVSIAGDPGRFIAIIVLILQLTTSAGTFPLELIPKPLQIFNTVLPMTYTVSAFKASISTGDYSFLWTNYTVLLSMMAGFLVITFGYFLLLYKKRYSKIAEENETAKA
ncbi:phage infection protein [Lysinibacillus alkalisoli]|uniref:Phage infection protein n=1 Tax=Lysinibacillus alkalisoli TaxID=1911548 RepID=A0A917G543_9BACI|nr:YhgE/Pip domain-containing protein [Lysinibacillus alkalisoli]GGG23336.1 phage infection protein [Lysinibacillus alkalisoli]